MIIQLLLQIVLAAFAIVFSWLPTVTTLPYGIDTYLSDAVGYFNGFTLYFPFLATLRNGVLIYIGFRLSLMILNFILGSRTPKHT